MVPHTSMRSEVWGFKFSSGQLWSNAIQISLASWQRWCTVSMRTVLGWFFCLFCSFKKGFRINYSAISCIYSQCSWCLLSWLDQRAVQLMQGWENHSLYQNIFLFILNCLCQHYILFSMVPHPNSIKCTRFLIILNGSQITWFRWKVSFFWW